MDLPSARRLLVLVATLQLVLPPVAAAAACAPDAAPAGCCAPRPAEDVPPHACCGPRDGTRHDALDVSPCPCVPAPMPAPVAPTTLPAGAVVDTGATAAVVAAEHALAADARRARGAAWVARANDPPARLLHESLQL